jgi:hypothetical protein
MFESCTEIREQFTDFLDDRCTRDQLRSIRFHLEYCGACGAELAQAQAIQAELRALPKRRVPAELALQMRVRVSQRLHERLLSALWMQFDNVFRPLVIPASGGILTAVIFFGLIMGTQFVPRSTLPDVPLALVTPPRLRELPPIDFINTGDQPVVLLTQVDAAGRVMSYTVLSGQVSPEFAHQLDRLIYFSVFDPATTFGRPTDGHVVLSLRRINVRG